MTNAELIAKIKAEIERLYDEANNYDDSRHYLGEVLSFLDTIEESEKSVPNDLEEAAKEHVNNIAYCDEDVELAKEQSKRDFIAGAKWQKEQTEKRWLEDRDGCFWDGVEEGKKAMKEQMMKEAVEWTVTTNLANRPVIYLDQLKGFQYGDKVRIIIVKE